MANLPHITRGLPGIDRAQAEILAAIVASSDDAIISKTLEGRITSWNTGATRIFGYEPGEIVGQPITRLVPPELHQQEVEALAKLRRGERIEPFDTVRLARDGRRIDISLTVSPVHDRDGNVIGASNVARDITERKQSEELQRLLFEELNHRVKNTLATIQAIASQSLRRAASAEDFAVSFNGRIQALARAHDLLVERNMEGADVMAIVREQVTLGASAGDSRIHCSGPHAMLGARASVQLALVLHELATNARKYGALSIPAGRLSIGWSIEVDPRRELLLDWRESGVPKVSVPTSRGFGMTLIERSLEANGGGATIRYGADGVVCGIRIPLAEESRRSVMAAYAASVKRDNEPRSAPKELSSNLRGKRILLIEDEPLVAMEIESRLEAAGCEVIGPAGTVESARRLISEAPCHAALVDANLGGHSVDELAAALTQKGIPFAFATGYGREGLPQAFQEAIVLAKPFSDDQLSAALGMLLSDERPSPPVVSLSSKRV